MVAKKTPAKKSATKKIIKKFAIKKTSAKKPAKMQSFRVYKDDTPFTTFRLTRQTFYWAILLIFIIMTQLWLLQIQMDIADLTNSLMVQ